MELKENIKRIKHSGQVYTPDSIVNNMFDFCGYTNDNRRKHFIDNSCGDGAFLCAAVSLYCKTFLKSNNNKEVLKQELETFIHGIEIDKEAYCHCIYNLNSTAKKYGVLDVTWDVVNDDALLVDKYNSKMDYVVGNPPYVRVHNLENSYDRVKTFTFAVGGMTDIYLVFYELGFRMLNNSGKLCYITPSSWLNSVAAANMRNYIISKQNMVGIIDFGHYQAFENIITYVAISYFDKNIHSDAIDYYCYDALKKDKIFVDRLKYKDMNISSCFYLGTTEELSRLRKIKEVFYRKKAIVKNGYATLSDEVFILNVKFSSFTIPIIKGSTGKWHKGFFPYDKKGKPLSKSEIFGDVTVAEYLNANREKLLKGKSEKQNPEWYLYGRTQALKDTFEDKLSINCIIKDISSIKINKVPKGSGLYSGLYILSNADDSIIENVIKSSDFLSYLKILKKYKSGGYYTFNSKDLEQYLNYKLSTYENIQDYIPNGQSNVSQLSLELFS